jgi:hypothetical protein
VEYYAPQGTPHNPRDICQGKVTEIFPSEGLSIITDTHLIIDGLHPITYGRPIRLNREGEWISTDNCECIVDRQDDGVRCQSGKFKAVVDDAKESFYTSKESVPLRDRPLFHNSSEEESNEGGLVKGGVKGGLVECTEFEVKQTPYGSVHRPCGLKQDDKPEALSQLREEQKRRKADKDDPTYVPEVPRKKNRKKSAGDCGFDVNFVFLFFSISSLMNSSNI